jgi:integrase
MGKRTYKGVRAASKSSIGFSFTCIDAHGHKGQRRPRIKIKPTDENLAWAQEFLGDIKRAIRRGTFDYATTFPDCKDKYKFTSSQGASLESFLDEWFEDRKTDPKYHSSTLEEDQKCINRYKPLYEICVSDLTAKDVHEWAKKQNVLTKTISNYISPLRVALDWAVHPKGIITTNPIKNVSFTGKKKRTIKQKRHKCDPVNVEERDEIINTATGQLQNIIRFSFWSGLRPSEAFALEWSDVDFERGRIYIDKAITSAADEPEEPKTEAAIRFVKLFPESIKALKDQLEFTEGETVVFNNPHSNKPWNGDASYRGQWETVFSHTSIKRHRSPYQTRHTYASMMLSADVNCMWVSKQLGHTSSDFTRQTYARWIDDDSPGMGQELVDKFSPV